MNARDWLRENGYEDVAGLIDVVMAELETRGSKQRRNWWDVLAGGATGGHLLFRDGSFRCYRSRSGGRASP